MPAMRLARSAESGVRSLPVFLLAVGAMASCGRGPVGEMAVSASELELRYPARVELTVSWTPWHALSGLQPPLNVFVHLRDDDGAILRTFDHPFPGEWEPGRAVQYPLSLYQSALGTGLAPGRYELTVGLYDPAGRRWPLSTAAPEVARQEYRVATVSVPPANPRGRPFEFSKAWGEAERDEDVQLLGRRWLQRGGNLRLAGGAGKGVVWMRLHIPAGTAPGNRLELAEPDGQQAVRVATDCGAGEQYLSGPGTHEIALAVEPPQGAGSEAGCAIQFEPNFHVVDLETRTRRVLRLDVLTWTRDVRGR